MTRDRAGRRHPARPRGATGPFRDLILRAYPQTSDLGISRACSSGGRSEHKEGRAWDWGVDVNSQGELADEVLEWLLATDVHGNRHALVRRFGIMYMIWNRRIWSANQADQGWKPYTGPNPHTNHVHFSFGWKGARKETSWWRAVGWSRVSVGVPSLVDTGRGMVVLGVSEAGQVTHRWQNEPGGAWSGWADLGKAAFGPVGRPVALVGRGGGLVVFVRGRDAMLWHIWQNEPGGVWSDWAPLGGKLVNDPAVVLGPGGALSVFARDPGGRVTHTWQHGPDTGYAWNEHWVDMDAVITDPDAA